MNWKFKLNRMGLHLQKNAPTILTWLGVVSIPVSIFMACKATLKLDETLDEVQSDISNVKDAREEKSLEEYSDRDYKKDLTTSYLKAGFKLSKLYAPSAILAASAMGSVIGSHHLMHKRNLGLIMTYNAVKASFDQYRERVAELYGAEQEARINYGIEAGKVEVEETDSKGKTKTVKKNVDVIDKDYIHEYSPYARFFDEYNPNWEKTPEYNLMFIKSVQNWANDTLRRKGHLFLNRVYEALGFKDSQAGALVGWIYDPDNPDHAGDNYIDFSIYDISMERAHAFVNGYESSILLDFNVDGVVIDLIEDRDGFDRPGSGNR